jgi:hypothetical protein
MQSCLNWEVYLLPNNNLDIHSYETFSSLIKGTLSLKRLRFLWLLIRPLGLCTQAFKLVIFNNFCKYFQL